MPKALPSASEPSKLRVHAGEADYRRPPVRLRDRRRVLFVCGAAAVVAVALAGWGVALFASEPAAPTTAAEPAVVIPTSAAVSVVDAVAPLLSKGWVDVVGVDGIWFGRFVQGELHLALLGVVCVDGPAVLVSFYGDEANPT